MSTEPDRYTSADFDALLLGGAEDGREPSLSLDDMRATFGEEHDAEHEKSPLPRGKYPCIVIDPPWSVTKLFTGCA